MREPVDSSVKACVELSFNYNMEHHATPAERAAVRSAFFDAAHIVDAFAREAGASNKTKREMAALCKRIGDTLSELSRRFPVQDQEPST